MSEVIEGLKEFFKRVEEYVGRNTTYVYAGGTTKEIGGYLKGKIIDNKKGKKAGYPNADDAKKFIITKSSKILLENDPSSRYYGNETALIKKMLEKWKNTWFIYVGLQHKSNLDNNLDQLGLDTKNRKINKKKKNLCKIITTF